RQEIWPHVAGHRTGALNSHLSPGRRPSHVTARRPIDPTVDPSYIPDNPDLVPKYFDRSSGETVMQAPSRSRTSLPSPAALDPPEPPQDPPRAGAKTCVSGMPAARCSCRVAATTARAPTEEGVHGCEVRWPTSPPRSGARRRFVPVRPFSGPALVVHGQTSCPCRPPR